MRSEESEKKAAKQTHNGAPPPEAEQLPCPRCESVNTKFCYYNNYNFSQPRHFCKGCRRYWTHGGTLRDIPVGGGSRKNAKRSRISNTISPTIPSYDFSCIPSLPFIVDEKDGMNMCGSFTSLLNTRGTNELLGINVFGYGIDQINYGLGSSGFGDGGDGGGGMVGNTWQLESGATGFVGGECFTTNCKSMMK